MVYSLVCYIIAIIYLFRVSDECKKYKTNSEMNSKAPKWLTILISKDIYERTATPSPFNGPQSVFSLLFAPLLAPIAVLVLISFLLYKSLYVVPTIVSKLKRKS